MMTADTTKVNASRTKTSRTSLVVLLVLCLLTEGYAKTTLTLPTRFLDRYILFHIEFAFTGDFTKWD